MIATNVQWSRCNSHKFWLADFIVSTRNIQKINIRSSYSFENNNMSFMQVKLNTLTANCQNEVKKNRYLCFRFRAQMGRVNCAWFTQNTCLRFTFLFWSIARKGARRKWHYSRHASDKTDLINKAKERSKGVRNSTFEAYWQNNRGCNLLTAESYCIKRIKRTIY